jgi:O-antigen/teichoic acid export membrane protein
MPSLRTNIFTNYLGQGWIALMSIVFIPVYVRMLGAEAFGLVGVMLSLQAISLLLDFGLGGVMNRELARRSHTGALRATIGRLVRSFEWIVWPMAIAIALIIVGFSHSIETHWLNAQNLPPPAVERAIVLIGCAVAALWPTSFYTNGLSGLERQPVLNATSAGFATLRGAGVIAAMRIWGEDIQVFLAWNVAVNVLNSLTVALLLWRYVPRGEPARFDISELHATGRFAGGLLLITALAVVLAQLDRLVLSRTLPLAELGYYTVAVSVVGGLGRLIQPMFNAIYPRFSRLVAQGEDRVLRELYHLGNQTLAPVVLATAAILAAFAHDVLWLWTGQAALADKVALPLQILVAATALNGLINLPYALQLAHGWTRLTVLTNLACLVLGVPYTIWATHRFGVAGAATLALGVNLINFFVNIPMMHRRLLSGELKNFYLGDILPAALVATSISVGAKWLIGDVDRSLGGMTALVTVSLTCLAATAASMPRLRDTFISHLRKRHGR